METKDVIELPIPTGALITAVDTIMQERGYVPAESLKGKTIKMKEFSKKYCGNRAPEWIRTFIFDEYPEVDVNNGGWVVHPRRTKYGKTTIIFENRGAEWMEEHQLEIDWDAKLP
ncbi:DUF771 domain-containing protein [Lactobacillus bombicola]|uniref:DUF771 domain-containing protein n=1 Tax=Lactobacillus bombicola TaxID=1505723 RepID=A0A396SPU8_9LACO|nr:DUF771 domain-containing protein [Lactobacillus bombicola]RHW53686.1 hypothetical protein DS835_07015 [Lactobacillus bombicola]